MEGTKRKHEEGVAVESNGTGDDVTQAIRDLKNKKKKKKNENETIKPSISYDLDKLFSNNGKRSGGNHLNFNDIRSLIMLTVHGERFPCLPTWCRINNWATIKKTVVIVANGISPDDHVQHRESFTNLNQAFDDKNGVPIQNEGYNHTLKSALESFLFYRMPKRLQAEKEESDANADTRIEHCCDVVLTESQLCDNEYTQWNSAAADHGVVTTRKNGQKVAAHKGSKIFAIDCEMCKTGNESALTRVTVLNEDMGTIYDEFVKPDAHITDYVTKYSGITAELLEDVTTRLTDVQQALLKIIEPDSILIGHSLDFDMRALKFHHDNIVDTSLLYVDHRGPRYKSSLKFLAKNYLNVDIQTSSKGHCSIEDAKTCMELVKLKVANGKSFGNPKFDTESIYEALHRAQKKGSLLDEPHIIRQHVLCNRGIPCLTDKEVVDESKKSIAACNFTLAHLRMYGDYLRGKEEDSEEDDSEKKSLLSKVDENIGDMLRNIPCDCLVIVSLCNGYIPSHIARCLKDKEKRKTEPVRSAIRQAKKGLCFVKIT